MAASSLWPAGLAAAPPAELQRLTATLHTHVQRAALPGMALVVATQAGPTHIVTRGRSADGVEQ